MREVPGSIPGSPQANILLIFIPMLYSLIVSPSYLQLSYNISDIVICCLEYYNKSGLLKNIDGENKIEEIASKIAVFTNLIHG